MQSAYEPTGLLLDAGFTLQEVLALRDTAKAELIAGAVRVSQWSGGGTSATRFYELSTYAIVQECKYALERLDPETHATNVVPNTTTAVFG